MPLILRRVAASVPVWCAVVIVGILPLNTASAQFIHMDQSFVVGEQMTLCKQANKLRKLVIKKDGKRAPGRDICINGKNDGQIPTLSEVLKYEQTLRYMAYPPAAISVAAVTANASSASYSGGLPACASESGTNYSTGPANTNPSGATGRYQIIPSTHASLCPDLGWSPAEQDACARRIYAAQGIGAWVGCGG